MRISILIAAYNAEKYLTETIESVLAQTVTGWVSRHADLGVFIASPEHRSKGYGQAAIRLMARHAFHDLGLHRLCLSVLADNAPAIHAYEKCGFQVEGTLRRHVFKRGAFLDVIVMGLCIEDWQTADVTNDQQTTSRAKGERRKPSP